MIECSKHTSKVFIVKDITDQATQNLIHFFKVEFKR